MIKGDDGCNGSREGGVSRGEEGKERRGGKGRIGEGN